MLGLGQATKKTTSTTYTTPSEQGDFNSLVEKYMLLDKKTLAELLALKEFQKDNTYSAYPAYPTYPYIPPQGPWVTYCTHCTNTFHDCINCPQRTTSIKFTTTSTTANEQ